LRNLDDRGGGLAACQARGALLSAVIIISETAAVQTLADSRLLLDRFGATLQTVVAIVVICSARSFGQFLTQSENELEHGDNPPERSYGSRRFIITRKYGAEFAARAAICAAFINKLSGTGYPALMS
jgi:hypothetical protein